MFWQCRFFCTINRSHYYISFSFFETVTVPNIIPLKMLIISQNPLWLWNQHWFLWKWVKMKIPKSCLCDNFQCPENFWFEGWEWHLHTCSHWFLHVVLITCPEALLDLDRYIVDATNSTTPRIWASTRVWSVLLTIKDATMHNVLMLSCIWSVCKGKLFIEVFSALLSKQKRTNRGGQKWDHRWLQLSYSYCPQPSTYSQLASSKLHMPLSIW